MGLIRKFAAASSVLLLVSTACAAAGPAQNQSVPTADAAAVPATSEQADEQSGTEQATPTQTTSVPPSPDESPTPSQVPAPSQLPVTPAPSQTPSEQVLPTTTSGQTPPGLPIPATLPGQIPVEQGAAVPSVYVPKTEHDNTPWRFNMQQDGKSMSADQFDQWLKQRGVRVATGKPATPLVQNCPTPEGDKGDSDGDGIINCLDKCPASEAGQTIGRDGCPVPVSIDLKGVTFAYDKASLDPEAKAVLNDAMEILRRHPALKVEVAGHTDSRGDAAYNQALSERRATAVYDYLVENGIDEARLIGPIGFGEMRPLVPNQQPDGSDDPEGRATNRRTELNIQN